MLYEEKKPKTKDNHVGIEIECLSFMSVTSIKKIFSKYKLESYIEISDDGSIDTDGYKKEIDYNERNKYENYYEDTSYNEDTDEYEYKYFAKPEGYEFKILCKEKQVKEIILKVGKALKEIEAFTNTSCGLHVHLDMRNRDVYKSASKLLNAQSILLASVPKHRVNNTYCLPIKKNNNLFNLNKYHSINTESYSRLQTIEVRLHEGTINSLAIINWVKLLTSIVNGDFAEEPIRNIRKLPIVLSKYMKQRIMYAKSN